MWYLEWFEMKQETSLINTFRTIIYKQEENVNECMDWKIELSKRIKIDFHINWINLNILRIATICFAGLNSIVCILFYQSLWKYLCEKCWRSHFELQIQEFNCLHIHFHSHSYFLTQYTQVEFKPNSNNEFHLHFIPFFECLFKSVGYDTINYNPVHSLDCLYSIVSNLASDLSGITHFYFEHWNKLDSVRLFLPFPNNSIFSFLTPIPQRIETCYLERFGFGVMKMRQWMIEC